MNLLMTTNPGLAAEQDALPMEFLEFLGEGVVIENEYLDPLNYSDIEQDVTTQRGFDKVEKDQTGEVKKNDE